MRPRLVFWSVIIGCALLGAAGSSIIAARRGQTASVTQRFLLASMVNPPSTFTSPRTYNQTLVETVDSTTLAGSLTDSGYSTSSVTFDVLPDSFHIQATVSLVEQLDDAATNRLGEALATELARRSAALSSEIISTPVPATVRVVLTRTLPMESAVTQDPVATGLFGALAGALVGLFIGLSLPAKRS